MMSGLATHKSVDGRRVELLFVVDAIRKVEKSFDGGRRNICSVS